MAVPEIPSAEPGSASERYAGRHVVPVLVLEFNDERTRGRMREAGLLSAVVHLLIFIAVLLAPKVIPEAPIRVWTAEDLIRRRELTYLELPNDRQARPLKRPDTDTISDKDRVATSRRPVIDRKTLEELRDSRRPGPPGAPGPAAPPQAGSTPSQAASPTAASARTSPANQLARLDTPPLAGSSPNAFGGALSAGSAIEQATRAAAATRGGGGGAGGDFGLGRGNPGNTVLSNYDVLSDTMGVDFGPYLARVLHDVRNNWYTLIPEVARAPLMKRGKVSIQFVILKDGSVASMQLIGPSGDISLDRAAWGGITASNPFPRLPTEFGGQYLALRFHFYYNPDRSELR